MSRGDQPDMIALLQRAAGLHQAGDAEAALRCYDDVIAMNPDAAPAHCHRGNVLADLGRVEPALASYDQAITLDPTRADPYDFRGIVLAQTGRLHEALASLDRAVALDPDNLNALNNRANVLKGLDRLEEALDVQSQIVGALPDFAPAHNNRGNTLIALGRLGEAIASFDRAIALDSLQVQSHNNRANALVKLMRVEEAVESYRKSLAIEPRQQEILVNLAELLSTLARPEEAIWCYEQALALDPTVTDALLGLGDIMLQTNRPDLAMSCYQRILALDAGNADAFSHLGMACVQLDRRADALSCFDRALALNPQDPQTWHSRAHLLNEMGDVEGALASHDRALEIAPQFPYELGSRFHAAMRLARWQDFDLQREMIRQSVQAGGRLIAPFDLVTTIDDPALQRQCAGLFVHHELPNLKARPIGPKYPRRDRIRIGYFSADFRDHATMRLFLETLEAHDREGFEITAISFGPDVADTTRRRTERAVDRFIDVRKRDSSEIVRLSRDLGIDIAIDLKGFTQGNRTAAFVERVAPVQASYLGFPGTCSIPAIDYLIADESIIPAGSEAYYSEKIVFLPGSYQPNLGLFDVPERATRASMGLPEDAFVYCCFNQSYKITPDIFDVWMSILRQVPSSVLWLWMNQDAARSDLQRVAVERDVQADRLVFAGRLPGDRHLDRLRLADLFLDTSPCNAHTTASDALRMGLPLLTCAGKSFAARVAASLLNAMDLPELVTTDLAEYQARAVSLALDRTQFVRIREKLRSSREASSLFDPASTARKLEAAYTAMYGRYQKDLPPDHIRL